MSGDLDLEQRYRRVLRLLPGYYRDKWEEDMVAAFLDSWMTGDPDEDSVTMEYDRPSRQEVASVVGLAARLYLGGAGTPRRYFAWGQAVRLAVLAVVLVHATQGLSLLTLLAWRRHLAGWFPALPASLAGPGPDGAWPTVMYVVDCVWIVIFVALVLWVVLDSVAGTIASKPRLPEMIATLVALSPTLQLLRSWAMKALSKDKKSSKTMSMSKKGKNGKFRDSSVPGKSPLYVKGRLYIRDIRDISIPSDRSTGIVSSNFSADFRPVLYYDSISARGKF